MCLLSSFPGASGSMCLGDPCSLWAQHLSLWLCWNLPPWLLFFLFFREVAGCFVPRLDKMQQEWATKSQIRDTRLRGTGRGNTGQCWVIWTTGHLTLVHEWTARWGTPDGPELQIQCAARLPFMEDWALSAHWSSLRQVLADPLPGTGSCFKTHQNLPESKSWSALSVPMEENPAALLGSSWNVPPSC